jgi:hypothetical protein
MNPFLRVLVSVVFLLLLAGVASATVQVVASNTVRASNDTNTSAEYGEWKLQKVISLESLGNLTGSFNGTFKEKDAGSQYSFIMKKSGVNISGTSGTSTTNYEDTLTTRTFTFSTTFNATDTFELWANPSDAGYKIGDFRLMYDYGYDLPSVTIGDGMWGANGTYDNTVQNASGYLTVASNFSSPYPTDYTTMWLGYEGAGTTWNDSNVTTAKTVTFTGSPSWTTDTWGNTITLNGNNQYGSYTSSNHSDLMTIVGWFNSSDLDTNSLPRILDEPGGLIFIRNDTNYKNQIQIHFNKATTAGIWFKNNTIFKNTTYRYVLRYNQSSTDAPVLTLNGVNISLDTNQAPVGAKVSNVGTGYIGDSSAHTREFTGKIGRIGFYDRWLTDAESKLATYGGFHTRGNFTTSIVSLGDNTPFTNYYFFGDPTNNLTVFINNSDDAISWSGESVLSTNPPNLTYGELPESNQTKYIQLRFSLSSDISISSYINKFILYGTTNVTPSVLYFISPTKVNASENWGVNSTQIWIQTTETFNEAPILYWQDKRGSELRVVTYIMNQNNNTTYSYNFTNLDDGDYFYYVSANLSSSGNVFTSTYYVSIDWDLDQTVQGVYLWQQSDGRYVSNTTTSYPPNTFIEPEWKGWSSLSGNRGNGTLIRRCWNSTTNDIYDNNGACSGSDSSINLAYTINNWHPYLYELKRYVNASGTAHITIINRDPPAGYTFDKSLGYAMPMMPHVQDIKYINNSVIKFGVDCRYGGAGVYLASMSNLSKNIINNYDSGRQIQNSYYDDGNATEVYSPTSIWSEPWGWNPTLAGNIYTQPSNVTSCEVVNNTITISVDKLVHWNPSYNNGLYSDLGGEVTYSFDGENPVLTSRYLYTHNGNVTHLNWAHETPTFYGIKELTHAWFRNSTTLFEETPISQGYTVYYESSQIVYISMLNDSDWGVGLWNNRRPQVVFFNFSLNSDSGTAYDDATNKISVMPYFLINKTGEVGSNGSNIGRIYVGTKTEMDTYYTGLEFAIQYDPLTPTNQTIESDYVYVRVNATDTAIIESAYLKWTNSTGTYNLSMTISELGDYVYRNMTGLSLYNYSYNVSAAATTGAAATTSTVWTNITDITAPASITAPATATGNFFINNTWTNPEDADFNGTIWKYVNGTSVIANQSSITTSLNLTWSAHYAQNISAQTVDTSGNINQTKVWFNATIPNNAPTLSNTTNQTVNEGEIVFIDIDGTDLDSDTLTWSINRTDLFTDFNILTGQGNWTTNESGVYYIDVGVYDGYININSTLEIIVQIIGYEPPIPMLLSNNTGNFWINTSYQSGIGNITNSYNVSNGTSWLNGTNTYLNETLSPHAWSNLSIYPYNSSGGGTLGSPLLTYTQIPNNLLTITNFSSDYSLYEGETFSLDLAWVDLDTGDGATYSDNSSDWSIDVLGHTSWIPDYTESGNYSWEICGTDGYQTSLDCHVINVTVLDSPLSINSTTPTTPVTTTIGISQSFDIETNRTADYTWYLNETSIQTNLSVSSATYTNSSSAIGVYNITVIVSDVIDEESYQWDWTVTAEPVYSISGYVFDNIASPLSNVDVRNGTNYSTSNGIGYYSITGMINGSYNLTFNKTGFTNNSLDVIINGTNLNNQNQTIYDNSSPSQVTNLTNGTISQNTIDISWDSVSDANHYRVYRNDTLLGITTNTYYNDTGLTLNTPYSYVVSANDSYNNTGLNSTPLNISTSDAYTLSGYVISSTGTLLDSANVSYSGDSNLSNASGYYQISNISNGTYNFLISKTGYDNNITSVTINGSDLSQNFTLTLTPTPTPTIAPSGSGGSTTVTPVPTLIYVTNIRDLNNNPPLLEIKDTSAGAIVTLTNEGNASQEYILAWNVRDLTFNSIIESGESSKLIKVNESYDFVIDIKNVPYLGSKYRFDAIAQYGIYQSKSTKILINDNYSYLSFLTENIFLIITIGFITLFFILGRKLKNRR